jgi:hypothetical protein
MLMTRLNWFRCGAALAIAGCLPLAPALADDDSRWLTPTMIMARAHMFDANLNFLTFQHMDKMFASRTVEAGGEVWELPYEPISLEGEYTIGDQTLSPRGGARSDVGQCAGRHQGRQHRP